MYAGIAEYTYPICTILRLLTTWVEDFPPATASLLSSQSNVQLLLDIAQHKYAASSPGHSDDPRLPSIDLRVISSVTRLHAYRCIIQCKKGLGKSGCRFGEQSVFCNSLAAVLLGACLLYGETPSQQPAGSDQAVVSPSVLLDTISSRIGMAAFLSLLDAFKQHPQLTQSSVSDIKAASHGVSTPSAAAGLCPFD